MNFATAIANTAHTANGAISSASSLNACLDLFSMGVSSTDKTRLISAALLEDPLLATKVVFYLRDCRQGQGNKDILHAFISILAVRPTHASAQILKLIPQIGYWKDLIKIAFYQPQLYKIIIDLFVESLKASDNLCAKWTPRKGQFANDIRKALGLKPKEYRQLLVKLTSVVEQKMCAREWSAINYAQVPSRANKLYKKAFLAHDPVRRQAFLAKVMTGEVKLHAARLYPHEISMMINRYNYADDSSANALWKSLPNYMENKEPINVLPIIDLSSSMDFQVPGTTARAMQIAIGLGLYVSEHNTGHYKDLWCTFSERPQFNYLKGTTLADRVRGLDYQNWGGSTNLQAVFDEILRVAQTTTDLPQMILIVSDMEFNRCDSSKTNLETINKKYAAAGIKPPVIVFWRVNVSVPQQPALFDTPGVVLINGYSPSIMKELLAGDLENMTPQAMMLKALGNKYDYLDEIIC